MLSSKNYFPCLFFYMVFLSTQILGSDQPDTNHEALDPQSVKWDADLEKARRWLKRTKFWDTEKLLKRVLLEMKTLDDNDFRKISCWTLLAETYTYIGQYHNGERFAVKALRAHESRKPPVIETIC